jgi:hypothetical protein
MSAADQLANIFKSFPWWGKIVALVVGAPMIGRYPSRAVLDSCADMGLVARPKSQ